MRNRTKLLASGLAAAPFVAWLGIGQFSDALVGNHMISTETLKCDSEAWCEQAKLMFIADSHNDTLMHREPGLFTKRGHSDLGRMVEGGVNLQIFAIASVAPKIVDTETGKCGDIAQGDRLNTYFFLKEPTSPSTWNDPMKRVDHMIDRFDTSLANEPAAGAKLNYLRNQEDLAQLMGASAGEQNTIGAVLAIEGAYWASRDPNAQSAQIAKLFDSGVRMIGLTHRSSNQLAGSNEDCHSRHGLTTAGQTFVRHMWEQNIILDLAHASSQTISDVLELSRENPTAQVIVSHTGVQTACQNDRNLTNQDLRNIARMGGVVSLGFWTTVNCLERSVSAWEARKAIGQSFKSAYQVLSDPEFLAAMGEGYEPSEHLAIGSDFDGATLVPAGIDAMPWYLEGIAKQTLDGEPVFSQQALENLAGLNVLRLLKRALVPKQII